MSRAAVTQWTEAHSEERHMTNDTRTPARRYGPRSTLDDDDYDKVLSPGEAPVNVAAYKTGSRAFTAESPRITRARRSTLGPNRAVTDGLHLHFPSGVKPCHQQCPHLWVRHEVLQVKL